MRASASTTGRKTSTGVPRLVTPTRVVSWISWLSTRKRLLNSWPRAFTISASVMKRCRPNPMTINMSSSGTPAAVSSSSTKGSRSCDGQGRVKSLVRMAMRCPRRTTSRNRGFPIGFAMAAATRLFWSAVAEAGSGLYTPSKFESGTSTDTCPRPYAKSTD